MKGLTGGKIGLVFQNDVLWDDLTVKEHLELMGRLLLHTDNINQKVQSIIDSLCLKDFE